MARLVISLDFELFWGVFDTQTVAGYGANVRGVWQAIPAMLALFRRYGIRATWATVGMAMCRDAAQWRAIRPAAMPAYHRQNLSPYTLGRLASEQPELFFARPLVERILDTPGQELASHTYSHFYCREAGATPEQFAADLECAAAIAADMGVRYTSLVLPRNQVDERFLPVARAAGIAVYRGVRDHWLYRNGDAVAGGIAGRAVRLADGCLPLSGHCGVRPERRGGLVNLPASLFLYPWSERQAALAPLRLRRLKRCMTDAARAGRVCHLWWHPHNFGVHTARNLAQLESLLQHYRELAACYGMQSGSMEDFAPPAEGQSAAPAEDQAAPPVGRFAAGSLP